jgi:predicted HTH transcriptional regulator
MNIAELNKLLAGGETLEVEFKGEAKGPLNDRDLVEAVVCLANAKGGRLLIGVEDNAQVTGARPRHGATTVPAKLTSMVRGRTIPALEEAVEELISLNLLFQNRRVTSDECATAIQRPVAEARSVLERLVEEGLIEAKGERRGRVFHFSAKVYRHLGKPEDHTRVHGLDPIRQEAAILQFVTSHGSVRRENVMELCGLDRGQAFRLLKRLVVTGKLRPEGVGKGRKYFLETPPPGACK